MNTPVRRLFAALLSSLALLAVFVLWNRSAAPRERAAPPAASTPGSAHSTEFSVPGSATVTTSDAAPSATAASSLADTSGTPEEFARFNDWLHRYLKASISERAAILVEGRAHATARRATLASLITTDPRRALALAVPVVIRQQLPADIVALLEERVSTRGSLGVLGAVGVTPGSATLRRVVQVENGPRYHAFVFGRRAAQVTTNSIHVTGIAIDRALALDERPFRILEAGEIPDASKPRIETCLVSGKIADALAASNNTQLPAITEDTPAIEIDGTIHYVCSGGHIQIIEERLVAGEGASGGAIKPTTAITSTQSTGVRSLLYMRVTFPDSNRDPQSETAAYDMMRQVNDWFVENSYGNLYIVTTVAPLIVLPRSEAWYVNGGGDEYDLRADAQEVARRMGYDTNQYDLDIVTYTGGPGGFGGLGYVGGKGSWIKSISVGVICHELGHNFGVWHANFWNTSGASIIGNGSNTEYGNNFDTMGSAGAGDLHFNANHKNILNWLPAAPFVQTVTTSGTYRVTAFDQPSLNPASRYALKIVKDSDRDYWAEFRQRSLSSNRWTKDGLLLNWSAWYNSNNGAQLLDTTPGSPDDRTDAALTVGRTFSDFEAGIHLTPLGRAGTTPESMDVVVNLGTFPGNQEPSLSLSSSATTVALNTNITFTATAADPDGDALSYAWDFGDKTFHPTNSALVTKNWSTAGDYVVRCVVSDMKGKTASRSTVIRVGSPTTVRVSGQITLAGQPLANVRVHNGLTGASYRGTFTNTDGTYTIAGLASGTYTLGAALDGFGFTASFTNPLSITTDTTGANFSATAAATVSLAVTDTDCVEGANTGRFTLTRTGATTSALTVRFFYPTGTAPKGSDYTLAPDLASASPGYTATILAGAASLDLVVTATDDATAEGPETATLELAPGSGYTISGPAIVTLIIQDNDTTKPVVTLRTADAFATEATDSASYVISRTGDTSLPLSVSFNVGGTASFGLDYTSLGTSVTIPAGASSATLTVAPLNDSIVEGTETVTVAFVSNAAYIMAPGSTVQTVSLLDDDIPTITVSAIDSTAAEAGSDIGVFLIARTGDTSLPLTINYALSGSAAQGVDYLPVPGVLTLPVGASSGTVTIEPVDDTLGEPAQTVVLQIRSSLAYISGSPSLATITITDNNDPPTVTVGIADGAVSEPSDTGRFRITTTGTGTGNITVRYSITGTATNGADFTALPGTLSIGRNTTSDITVTPLDDAFLENIETITFTLTPDAAYSTHLDTEATLNLVDNDQACVNVTADNLAFSESGGTGRFYVSRTGATTAALIVNFTLAGSATNGTDYNAISGSTTIAAGASGVSIDLIPINDTLAEGSETVVLTLASGSYGLGLSSASLILTDNEVPAVQVRFAASTATVAETAGALAASVTLSAPAPAGGITVDYLLGGGTALGQIDYQFTPGVLTFAAGESAKTIPLVIIDDTAIEPSQTVVLRLANPTGASLGISTMTYTITDNDPAVAPSLPAVTVLASTPAGGEFANTPAVFTLLRTGGTTSALTVNFTLTGTAVAGSDYSSPGISCVIPAGQSSASVNITPLSDALIEGSENVTLTLAADAAYTAGSPASATATLADLPVDNWRLTKFGSNAADPAISGDLADPDGDGLVNLLEYATGADPLQPSAPPQAGFSAGQLTLTYDRALTATDILYTIEEVSLLNSAWTQVATTDETLADNGVLRKIKSKVTASGPSKFLRLRVTR